MSRLTPVLLAALVTGCTTSNLVSTDEDDAGSGIAASSSGGGTTLRPDGGNAIPDAAMGDTPDAAMDALDAGMRDASSTDAAGACSFGTPGPEDKERVLLTSRAYLPDGGRGTSLRSLSLMADGTPVDNGVTLDVGERVDTIAFVPSGELALVLGEDGLLTSVRVFAANALQIVDTLQLPGAGYHEMHISDDGTHMFVLSRDSAMTGGIEQVLIACDGTLRLVEEGFFRLRLADSMARIAGSDRWFLLGGQALFMPEDLLDTRLLSFDGMRLSEVASFDIWTDIVSTGRVDVSPDGVTAVVANDSVFSDDGSQMSIMRIDGDTVTQTDRIMIEGPSQVLFSVDGSIVLITQPESNRVSIWKNGTTTLQASGFIGGIGLADQMAMIRRGALRNTVYLPAIDTSGVSNIQRVRITEGMGATDLGQVNLGEGLEDIPTAIAVTP